ncbi:MAG: hypothetical protein QME41_08365 [Actinomycetota bacterium]|nr:hypothetical protein [Actinomycetota bacterium]
MDMLAISVGVIGLSAVLFIAYRWSKMFAERGMIEITRVELSDDGSAVDITYLVKKPGRILDRRGKVYLLDEMRAKKVNAISASELGDVIDINSRRDPSGSIRVPNKYKLVRKGSVVTVAIGDYRREDLIVV